MSNPSEMNGYISIIFLISVALTFHGTEARRFQGYEGICEDICEKPENTTGCPAKLSTLGFFHFSQANLIQS